MMLLVSNGIVSRHRVVWHSIGYHDCHGSVTYFLRAIKPFWPTRSKMESLFARWNKTLGGDHGKGVLFLYLCSASWFGRPSRGSMFLLNGEPTLIFDLLAISSLYIHQHSTRESPKSGSHLLPSISRATVGVGNESYYRRKFSLPPRQRFS